MYHKSVSSDLFLIILMNQDEFSKIHFGICYGAFPLLLHNSLNVKKEEPSNNFLIRQSDDIISQKMLLINIVNLSSSPDTFQGCFQTQFTIPQNRVFVEMPPSHYTIL